MINKKFWKNKKILITGHTGFKGRWFSIILRLLGSEVYGISLHEKKNYKKIEYMNFLKQKNCFNVDIIDKKEIQKIFLKINPEIIIHMAAQSKVIDGLKFPVKTFETNYMGTINVLNSTAILKKIKTILIVTTDKVYENNKKVRRFSESDKLGGDDPYSASKASSEIIIDYYRKLMPKTKIISVRAGNIIGGGDFGENRIIPDLIKAWIKNEKLLVRNPKSTRPWQYVLDVLITYMKLIEKSYKLKKMPLIFNVGPFKSNLSVDNLVHKLKIYFKDLKIIYEKRKNINFEKKHLFLDIKNSVNFLKLKNDIDFNDRIQRTSVFYKQILNTKKNYEIEKIYKNEALAFLSKKL